MDNKVCGGNGNDIINYTDRTRAVASFPRQASVGTTKAPSSKLVAFLQSYIF